MNRFQKLPNWSHADNYWLSNNSEKSFYNCPTSMLPNNAPHPHPVEIDIYADIIIISNIAIQTICELEI